MIESDPIPTGENQYIKICVVEEDYRMRITDLFGNILFELVGDERFKFNSEFTRSLMVIQELMTADKKKKDTIIAYRSKTASSSQNLTSDNSINPDQKSTTPPKDTDALAPNYQHPRPTLKLVSSYPPLSDQELQVCVQAMKQKQKIYPKITIEGTSLEFFMLQAFDGEKKSVYAIVNESAESNIALNKDSVRQTLERLVQEGKFTSSEQIRPDNNGRYIRFEFDTSSSSVKKNTLETILEKIDNEFNTQKFVMISSSQ